MVLGKVCIPIHSLLLAKLGFNGAETNCEIARILGILLMNSCDT